MITSKAIPVCRSPFQGESRMSSSSSSPKSLGAASYSSSPRRKPGASMVTMAYAGANFVRDPHTTLEIAPGASKHEIKKAYRRLALQYHPDVCDGNHCTTNFQQINFAYEVKQSPSTLSTGLDRRNSLSISSYSS
jgi:DnaJ-domain-containing protein 1